MKAVIVIYDISDDKRRKKVSEYLKDRGLERIQLSVFGGYIKEEYKEKIIDELYSLVEIKDRIHIIFLKEFNVETVVSLGDSEVPIKRDFMIF